MDSKQQEALNQEAPPPPYEDQSAMQQKQPLVAGQYPVQQQPGYPQQGYPQQQYPPQGYLAHYHQPVNPGAPVYNPVVTVYPGMDNPPANHLGLAIFATLCCCWPIGIFAILRASACKSSISVGDRATAERMSKEARKFSMWAIGIGVVFNLLSIAVVIVIYALYIIPQWDFL